MIRAAVVGLLLFLAFASSGQAQEYQAAKVDTPAPADAISPEIATLLQPTGFQVAKGSAGPVCEIWLAKEWPIAADATTGGEVLYPLVPGQLIGVARYPRKASDFREQDIRAGVYVIRYAQQPVDGAHVGTSPTRDFFALLPAAKDRAPQTLDYKTLVGLSKEVTGSAHPAVLSLQKAEGGEALAVREDADRGWVIVHFVGSAKQGGAAKELPVELVVVGKAAE